MILQHISMAGALPCLVKKLHGSSMHWRSSSDRKCVCVVLQVYLASSAPPVRFPNVYGVDMPNRKEFVAHGLTEDQVGGGEDTGG